MSWKCFWVVNIFYLPNSSSHACLTRSTVQRHYRTTRWGGGWRAEGCSTKCSRSVVENEKCDIQTENTETYHISVVASSHPNMVIPMFLHFIMFQIISTLIFIFFPCKFALITFKLAFTASQPLRICVYQVWVIWLCVWSACLCAWMSSLQHCMQIQLHESWLHLSPASNDGNSSVFWPYRCSRNNPLNALNLFRNWLITVAQTEVTACAVSVNMMFIAPFN